MAAVTEHRDPLHDNDGQHFDHPPAWVPAANRDRWYSMMVAHVCSPHPHDHLHDEKGQR